MVKYKLLWTPSVSSFSTTQNVKGTISSSFVTFGGPLPISASQLEYAFADNAPVVWYVETISNTGRISNSVSSSFIASNEAFPAPATGLTQQFVSYIP